jgi:hypothetical protein
MSAPEWVTAGGQIDLMPTLPGYVQGIVAADPFRLQCGDCTSTVTGPKIALLVILSGYHFHSCEGPDGPRRCPECLRSALLACSRRACQERGREIGR